MYDKVFDIITDLLCDDIEKPKAIDKLCELHNANDTNGNTRDDILSKVESIWDECQERNIGSNEAEFDFKESITDFIYKNYKRV